MASRSAHKAKMKKTREYLYNAKGAPEDSEAMDETPGFRHGGKIKKKRAKHKHGGHVEGEREKHRADRKPRGHHAHGGKAHERMVEERDHKREEHREHHKRASGGRTPYSSGHNPGEPKEAGRTDTGHEGQRPSEA